MDFTYLTICYYNLLEKYLCSMFNDEDWHNICQAFNNSKGKNG